MDESPVVAIHAAFSVGTPPARPLTRPRCDECYDTDRLLAGRHWINRKHNLLYPIGELD